MYYNIPYKLIIKIVAIIFALTIIGTVIIFMRNNSLKEQETEDKMNDKNSPVITYTLSSKEKNQKDVTVYLTISTENRKGINIVTLPDGQIEDVNGEKVYETQFIVKKNGQYTVKVEGKNKKSTEITINITNVAKELAYAPYLPDGFHFLEGEPEQGYVIEDDFGNQFVWVPVFDGKLIRNTDTNSKYQENESTASELVNSVAQNYGFYIGRYEASKYEINGKYVAASMGHQLPWTNISYSEVQDAIRSAKDVFEYSDEVKIALINSYAWDSTLDWLDSFYNDYSSGESYGNYTGVIKNTGETLEDIKNNICDLAGNVREWTTEIYNDDSLNPVNNAINTTSKKQNNANEINLNSKETVYRLLRGGSATFYMTAGSHTSYEESKKDNYWGFRMILYK